MSHIALETPSAGAAFPRLSATLAALLRRLRQARQTRTTVAILSRLSDRELADIGLQRGNILDVVAGLNRR